MVLGLTACGGSSTATPPTSKAPSTTSTSIPPPAVTTPTVTLNGHGYLVPTDDGHPIAPLGGEGTQIILTNKGFLPYHLFADLNTPVVWTNLTAKPVRIWFEYSAVTSKLIPPGGTFTYTSKGEASFVYRSSTGYHGQIDFGAFTS